MLITQLHNPPLKMLPTMLPFKIEVNDSAQVVAE